jgi:hypothetical protein
MQIEINKISDWLNINKLTINTTKTKFIWFRSSKKKQKYNKTISIIEQIIKQVKDTIFLGDALLKPKLAFAQNCRIALERHKN